jgi:TolB-like protein
VPLKNIAEPMRAYSLEFGAPREARSSPPADQAKSAPKRRSSFASLAAAGTLLLLVAAGGWYMLGDRLMKPAQAAHLSIVVLPFTNLSNDPAQDYFADGVTENLTTDLSRIRGSFVIARNTAFTFKGKSVDAKEIGKELGVRYVLEGSVQRDQNRVRVNAQLVDVDSGAHLWAQRFEKDVADLFKLQDQVVARLANTLGNELIKAEATKGARSTNPDANDLVMRGWALDNEQSLQPNKDKNNVERALFEQALAMDPNNVAAINGVAGTYYTEYIQGWGNSGTDYRQGARSVRPSDHSRAGLL